jgi:hypothetical protein
MLFMRAMREVQTRNIQAGFHEPLEDRLVLAGGANRRDDFCFAIHVDSFLYLYHQRESDICWQQKKARHAPGFPPSGK